MIPKLQKKITKKRDPSIWVLKILAVIRLLLGNYANISDSKPMQLLMKFYCFFCCSVIITGFFREYNIQQTVFSVYFISIVNYVSTAIVYFIYGDKSYLQFFRTINTNDKLMGFKKKPLITNFMYLFVIGNSVVRFVNTIHGAYFTLRPLRTFCAIAYIIYSMDFNNFTIIIIFAVLQGRMKLLRIFIESNSVPVNIIKRDEVAISIRNVRKSLYNYNNLLDLLEFVDQQLKYLLFINWTSQCLRIICLSCTLISVYMIEDPCSCKITYSIEMAQSIVLVSCPAWFVEATVHEVDRIKATLTRQLRRCSDESLRFELETALRYVTLRPFRYMICRAVPLDMYLPISFISFCITYIIVVLQLTHFSV